MTRGLPSPPPRGARLAFAAAIAFACLAPVPALAQGTGGDCQPDPQTLCLLDDRFEVTIEWHDFTPNPLAVPGTPDDGVGHAVPEPASGNPQVDGGYFWFFDSQNVDVVVKVLDGTQINGHFWIFAGSLTNVEYRITVVDTVAAKTQPYVNPPGHQTVVFDTNAFEDSPSNKILGDGGAIGGAGEALPRMVRMLRMARISRPVVAGTSDWVPRRTLLPKNVLPSCADIHVACVQGNRIAIEARVPSMLGGPVDHDSVVIVETGTSALFQHFAPNGAGLGVKIVDGRVVNGEFWVFLSGLSFPGMTVTVTDLQTHEQVTYVQEGVASLAIGENQPFAPDPPSDTWLETAELPGFRFQVRVTGGGQVVQTRQEADCIPETLCVSAAIPGRSELFLRIVGPKPNGFLQPNLVKFSTSQLEVWIEQTATEQVNYYELDAPGPASSDLTGFFDRRGFAPE